MKFKLGKTSQLILSAGIFIVVIASLGLTRSQQLREEDELYQQLSVVETRLDKLEVKGLRQQQEELQRKLDESAVQLSAVKDKLRYPIENIGVIDEFFAIAYSCGVGVNNISASSVRGDSLESIACSLVTLNVAVSGEVSDLINLVIKLNSDFTTGIVQSVQLSIQGETEEEGEEAGEEQEEEEEGEEAGVSLANIQIAVKAYEGD
ncbi:hypothetical protein ACFLX3_01290 [Chloroflexota bacterium]